MNILYFNSLNFSLLKQVQIWGDLSLMTQLQIIGGGLLVCLFFNLCDQISYICGWWYVLNEIPFYLIFLIFFTPEWAIEVACRNACCSCIKMHKFILCLLTPLQMSMLWIYHLFSSTKQDAYLLSLMFSWHSTLYICCLGFFISLCS